MPGFKRRGIIFPLLVFIVFYLSVSVEASLLRMLAPSGADAGNSFPDNFSENDFDLTRPALLPKEKKPKVVYSLELEDIYKLKKGDELKYLLYSYKNKLAFIYPTKLEGKFSEFDVALGFDTYLSKQKLFTNHDDIKSTDLDFKGNGHALSFGASYRNFSLGYAQQTSVSDGNGTSLELLNAISLLSPESTMSVSMGERKSGMQYGVTYKGTSLYFLKNNTTVPVKLRMKDGANDFYMPVESRGDSYEVMLLASLKDMPAMFFFQEGKSGSLDKFYYNGAPNLGTHLVRGRFKYFGAGVKRKKITLGAESYKGSLVGAASVDIIGQFFGLIGGYYLIHYNADLKFNQYKISYDTGYRKMPLHFSYHAMFFDLNMHYDSVQKFFLGFAEKNKTERNVRLNGYMLHNIGIGIKRKVKKNITLGYSIVQQLPPVQRKKTDKVTEKVGGFEPEETGSSKTTGGTLHIFTVQYDF